LRKKSSFCRTDVRHINLTENFLKNNDKNLTAVCHQPTAYSFFQYKTFIWSYTIRNLYKTRPHRFGHIYLVGGFAAVGDSKMYAPRIFLGRTGGILKNALHFNKQRHLLVLQRAALVIHTP